MEQEKKTEEIIPAAEQKKAKNKYFYQYTTIALLVVLVGVLAFVVYGGNLFSGKDVAAKVNGEEISVSELNRIYDSLSPEQKTATTKKDVLQSIIQLKIIYQEAQKEGFSVTEKEANENLESLLVSAGMAKEQFLQSLAQQNMNEKDFIKSYIEQLTAQKLINKTILQNIQILDADVNDFYVSNIEQFEKGEQAVVKHILIGDANLSKEEKESKAKDLLKKVNKENFCDYVNKHSTDTASVPDCGEYTFGKDDPYVEEFKNLSFSQKEGDIGTANTQFGTHIIWTVKKLPPGTATLAEVSEQIKEFLKAQKTKEDYDKFYQNLETKSKIKIYDEVLL